MVRHSDMASSNPLIIVVDADAAVRNSLKFSLEIDGLAVETYAGADELLHSADLRTCQCLVVDQDLPRMTGLELVASLRNEGVQVPIVLISGRVTPALTRRAMDVGIAVIEKPLLGNELIELIRTATGNASK
jgi:two-component system, LuxR family, response regulator FixJ